MGVAGKRVIGRRVVDPGEIFAASGADFERVAGDDLFVGEVNGKSVDFRTNIEGLTSVRKRSLLISALQQDAACVA